MARQPNGPIPAEIVAGSTPDGYTLLVSPNSLWIGKLLKPELFYDPTMLFSPGDLIADRAAYARNRPPRGVLFKEDLS